MRDPALPSVWHTLHRVGRLLRCIASHCQVSSYNFLAVLLDPDEESGNLACADPSASDYVEGLGFACFRWRNSIRHGISMAPCLIFQHTPSACPVGLLAQVAPMQRGLTGSGPLLSTSTRLRSLQVSQLLRDLSVGYMFA